MFTLSRTRPIHVRSTYFLCHPWPYIATVHPYVLAIHSRPLVKSLANVRHLILATSDLRVIYECLRVPHVFLLYASRMVGGCPASDVWVPHVCSWEEFHIKELWVSTYSLFFPPWSYIGLIRDSVNAPLVVRVVLTKRACEIMSTFF